MTVVRHGGCRYVCWLLFTHPEPEAEELVLNEHLIFFNQLFFIVPWVGCGSCVQLWIHVNNKQNNTYVYTENFYKLCC